MRTASSDLRLAELNVTLLRWLTQALGNKTPMVRSSELGVVGKRTHLLAEICGVLGATTYVSPLGSASTAERVVRPNGPRRRCRFSALRAADV